MAKKIDDKKPKLKLVSNNKKDFKETKKKDQPMTAKQLEFSRLIAEESLTSTDAYKRVYSVSPSTKDNTIWNMASELMANPKVTARIKSIQRRMDEDKLTRAVRREEYVLKKLTEEVEQGDQASNRIKALSLLGQSVNMFGNKLEVETKQTDKTSEEITEELKDKLSKLLGGKS
tara:strand:- start:716 stop:1237 length:522 start_codon:yes stop_codon:yes gene_type:complete